MHGGYGIIDPIADFGVARLADGIVPFSGCDERVQRVDVSFVDDGVNRHSEEIAKGGDEGRESVLRWHFRGQLVV